MKKILFIAAILLAGCSKYPKEDCCQCKDLVTPSNYVQGYCAEPDMVQHYMDYMAKIKDTHGKKRYECQKTN